MKPEDAIAKLRERRRQVLETPALLLGHPEPPCEALWAYVRGLTEAVDVLLERPPDVWSRFLRQRFGARGELRIMLDYHTTFEDRVEFLRNLYESYDTLGDDDDG